MNDQTRYRVSLEIAGPLALFSRPDTGAAPTSYPVPTFSAAKGIFESIAFFKDGRAWICPERVEVCKPAGTEGGQIRYQQYTANYGGPLRKPSLTGKGAIPGGSSMQVRATVLSDVCFRIHGVVRGEPAAGVANPRHHLKDLFDRRLKRGQCHSVPKLGWSEFIATYWGPIRAGVTEVDQHINIDIPSMVVGIWDRPQSGAYGPSFVQDVRIEQGVLYFPLPSGWQATDSLGTGQC